MKSVIKNKKAVEINIATIIILVLAILVLVILAMYFTGGMTSLWSQIIGKKVAYTGSALDDAKNKCENLFTIDQFCTQKVGVYNEANKTVDYKCCSEIYEGSTGQVGKEAPIFRYLDTAGNEVKVGKCIGCETCEKLNYNPCTPYS